MPDRFLGRFRISDEISFSGRVAPFALGIPMPRLHEEIRILPITDHSPSGRENLFNLIGTEERVGRVARNSIHRRSECVTRTKRIHHALSIDLYGLGNERR